MRCILAIVFLLFPWISSAEERPAGAGPPAGEMIVLEKCLIEHERSTTLGAFVLIQAGGRIQDSYVRLGSRVKAGQVLGRLHDRDARAEWERLTHEIEDNTEIPLCEARLAQTLAKVNRSRKLHERKMYSNENLEIEELDARTAALDLAQAKHHRRQNELTRARVEAEIKSREFVTPHDGIVVEVFKREGESTNVNESVYRVVDVNLLRVTGQVDVKDAWRVCEGQQVRVSPDIASADLPIEREVFIGRVTFVDSQINLETRTCKVVAEVNNRNDLLRSGLEARMEILLEPTPSPGECGPSGPESQ